MKYGEIAGIEKPVSRMGQGTIMVSSKNVDGGFALLDAAFEGGVTLYDTAHIYAGGDNETTVGKWVRSRGVREKIVMLGKGGHPRQGQSRISEAAIKEELQVSLDRFGFDYIDLYVLHRDDTSVPVGEIVEWLNEHKRAGLIRAFGGSNWTFERVRAANEYAAARGLVPFAASSPHFSLAIQFKPVWADCLSIAGPDHVAAREWYRQAKLPLVTWSSIARGFFSGRLTRENWQEKETIEECSRQAFCHPANFERLDRAFEMAKAKGLSVPQLAIAYVLNYPLNTFPLVGPMTPDEFRANLGALEVVLTGEEIGWLECGK